MIEFFNFGNDETFHFFKWLTESGRVDVKALLTEAYERVASDTEHFDTEDICVVARAKLTEMLLDRLEAIGWSQLGYCVRDGAGIGKVSHSDESFWLPLARAGLRRIDCYTVAEALLRQMGKWNPSLELPIAE